MWSRAPCFERVCVVRVSFDRTPAGYKRTTRLASKIVRPELRNMWLRSFSKSKTLRLFWSICTYIYMYMNLVLQKYVCVGKSLALKASRKKEQNTKCEERVALLKRASECKFVTSVCFASCSAFPNMNWITLYSSTCVFVCMLACKLQ